MRYKNEIHLGILVLISIIIFTILCFRVGGFHRGDSLVVIAYFPDATGLINKSDVKTAGVTIGYVRNITSVRGLAKVTMEINKDSGLMTNVEATIKAKSLLGEKFISLTQPPTTAPLLKNNDTIKNVYTTPTVEDLITQMGRMVESFSSSDFKGLGEALKSFSQISPATIEKTMVQIHETAKTLQETSTQLSRFIGGIEKSKPSHLIQNLTVLSNNLNPLIQNLDELTKKLNAANLDQDMKQVMQKLTVVLTNLEKIDKKAIQEILDELRKSLSKDGIKVKVF